MSLAAQHPAQARSVSVISSLVRPLRGAALRLPSSKRHSLARRRWFAHLQGVSMGVPASMMQDYIESSLTVDPSALTGVLVANNRYVLPETWSDYRGGSWWPTAVPNHGACADLQHRAAPQRTTVTTG